MITTKNTPSEIIDVQDLTERIMAREDRIDTAVNDTIALAVVQGEDLRLMKNQLEHGQWQPWLSENFPKHPSQARRYMQLAKISKRARARVLDRADSIRQALQLVVTPKPRTPRPGSESIQKTNHPPEPAPMSAELPFPKNGTEQSMVANQPMTIREPVESKIAIIFGTQILDSDGMIMEERNQESLEAAVEAWRQSVIKIRQGGGCRAILIAR